MPNTKLIQLSMIDEPEMPIRSEMDDKLLQELMESMQRDGQLQAIGLRDAQGRYSIMWGHRRYVAASQLRWDTIRAEVWQPDEVNGAAGMLAENRYREPVNAADEALLFAQHQMKDNLDEAGLCTRFHVSPDYLGDRMRLLRGDPEVFDALRSKRINFSVARELNKCPDEPHRRYLLDIAIRTGYSSAVMADHVRQWRVHTTPQPQPAPAPAPAAGQAADDPGRIDCVICGGYRDPWNLRNVWVHQAELDLIQKTLEQAATDK